jgi:MFS family permease
MHKPASGAQRSVLNSALVWSFYLPSLILSFSSGMLTPILPLYAKDFDISYGLIGLVLAGDRMGMLLGDIPAGLLLRRLGQKGTMLLGLGCTALSAVALFWARTVPEAVLYRAIGGFGAALYTVSRHAYIASNVTVASRGRAIALFGGIMRVGSFAGPMIGGLVAAAYGLRVPFLLFGGTYGVAVIVVLLAVRAIRPSSPPAGTALPGSRLFSALREQGRTLTFAGIGQIFAQMIRAGRGTIIPLYAADVIGLDVRSIGLIVSLASAVDMTLFYPAGWIMDHLGRKFAIVPSFALQAIGMFFVPFTDSFTGLLLAASLIGFANGFSSGSMMTLGADLSPEHSRGEFLGVWRLIGDVGSTGGPLVVGAVADLVVLPTAAWFMTGAGLIAAAVFALFVPETLKKRQRAPTLSREGG